MEDIRIGRATAGTQSIVPLTTSSEQIVQSDPKRVSLIFFAPVSGTLTVSSRNPVVANEGIIITPATPYITLTLASIGMLVTHEWYGIHSVGSVTSTILEGQLLLE